MHIYDIAVIGGGPAGMMASIRAGQLKKDVVLIEKNTSLGKKILLTGKGRCNITNDAQLKEFIEKFGREGAFLRSAFSAFFNKDLIFFFESKGLTLKVERQGRVFPVSDRAASVARVLKEYIAESKIKVLCGARLSDIEKETGFFSLSFSRDEDRIRAKKVILATGGASYRATGSTGDGFNITKKLGHKIIPISPGLVPLKAREAWVKELQGLTLKNIRLTFSCRGRKIISDVGELLFTHFGVSGPLVLDLSCAVIRMIKEYKEVNLAIDLKPGLSIKQIENRLLGEIRLQGGKNISSILRGWLPVSLIPVFLALAGVDSDKRANQLTKEERRAIIDLCKSLELTITGSLPIEEAMITCGGVSTKEINPRTMESRIVPGLYFAGEIIDVCAPSGGYNLQEAFSTGYLAGQQAAN